MSILSVVEDWRERTAEESTDGASATRVYTVEFDETDEITKRPLMALYATGIPRRYQVHPYNPWLYVRNKTSKTISTCVYEVTVNYDVRSSIDRGNDSDPFLNPLDEEPEIEWTFEIINEKIDRDLDDKILANSAGQTFDPPIVKDFHDLVLRIERNEGDYNPLKAMEYIGAVNSSPFWGFGAGLVRCTVLSGRKARKANMTYWRVAYEFKIRYAIWSKDGTPTNEGWLFRVVDEGMYTYGGADSDGDPIWNPIKDSDGHTVSQPVPLDGQGNKLSADRLIAHDTEFLPFRLYPEKDFSILGL